VAYQRGLHLGKGKLEGKEAKEKDVSTEERKQEDEGKRETLSNSGEKVKDRTEVREKNPRRAGAP